MPPALTRFFGSPWLFHISWVAAVLVAFAVLDRLPSAVHRPLAEYAVMAPLLLGAIAAVLAVVYNLANTALLVLVLLAAHLSQVHLESQALDGPTLLAWATVLVPFNFVIFTATESRGLISRFGAVRLAGLAVQGAILYGLYHVEPDLLVRFGEVEFLPSAWVEWTSLSHQGVVALGLGTAALTVVALLERTPPGVGALGALALFGVGAHLEAAPEGIYGLGELTAAAIIGMLVAILQEAHRLAFRDALTGLPNRRAMDTFLQQSAGRYTIAMLDVDHFKKFNDTYGHDVGDQVLRRVAAQVQRVGGGGRPFRYGGEEFAVIFPGRSVDDVLDVLDDLRTRVEADEFKLRSGERPRNDRKGRQARGGDGGRTVRITISIGVSEASPEAQTPDAVIKAADEALYTAKERGRNRVAHG